MEAIRDVDAGKMTANQAFASGGILGGMKRATLEECRPEERKLALESLALFAAMEINALIVLSRDLGEPDPDLFLAGSPAPLIKERVAELLGRDVGTLGDALPQLAAPALQKTSSKAAETSWAWKWMSESRA